MYDDQDEQFYQYPSRSSRGSSILATIVTSVLTTVAVFFGLRELDARGYLGAAKPKASGVGGVEVPNVVGLRLEQARELLKGKSLLISIAEEREDATKATGTIISHKPMAGSETQAGTTIQVVLARSVSTVLVPPVAGLKPDEATRQLTGKGLVLGPQKVAPNDSVAAGLVLETQPAAGSAVPPGSAVSLILAAPTGKPVPKVVGTRLTKAKRTLEEAGFKVGKTRYKYDPCCGEYIILKQTPEEGQAAPLGATVDLVVNEPG